MGNHIFIDFEKLVISGNVLDLGIKNYGIIYNLYKHYNDEVAVDYFEASEKKELIGQCYDNCILFFTLHKFISTGKKHGVLKDICNLLKEDGYIYIWDIDKGINKIFNATIKVKLPDKDIKELKIKEYNLLKNNSKENIKGIVERYCDIEEYSYSNNIFYMKAKKRGKLKDESVASSS